MSDRKAILSILTMFAFFCLTAFLCFAEDQAANYSGGLWSRSTFTEGVVGQLFPATLIARLVSLHVHSKQKT